MEAELIKIGLIVGGGLMIGVITILLVTTLHNFKKRDISDEIIKRFDKRLENEYTKKGLIYIWRDFENETVDPKTKFIKISIAYADDVKRIRLIISERFNTLNRK